MFLSIVVCPGLGISPLQTFGWVLVRPTLAQDWPRIFFFGFFWKGWNFFSKICAHSERNRNLLAGIFEILTFDGNIAFPVSPVLQKNIQNVLQKHVQRIILLLYGIQYTCNCCCLLLRGPEKKKKMAKHQAAARCTETDGQTPCSFFLQDSHHLLLA